MSSSVEFLKANRGVKMTQLSDALRWFYLSLEGEVSEVTEAHYRTLLTTLPETLTGEVDIEDITIEDLRYWRAYLREKETRFGRPMATASVNTHIRVIRRFFNWLVDEEMIPASPAKKLRSLHIKHQDTKVLTTEQVRAIYEEIKKTGHIRDLAIFLFLFATGCRVSGMLGIRLMDLDVAGRRAWIVGKGQKARWVFFDDLVAEVLETYLQIRPVNQGDQLFIGLHGPMTRGGIWNRLKHWAEKADVPDFTVHRLRHTFAVTRLLSGDNIAVVSDLLGHSTIHITKEFYAKWDTSMLQEQYNRFQHAKFLGE